MRKRKQVLLTAVCALLLVATSILGTIAYLTDQASVTNTFTVGKVDITLDEAKVNENGEPIDEDGNVLQKDDEGNYIGTSQRVIENGYHLIPGINQYKDPTVTVEENSEESYVRMILTVQNASAVQAIIDNDDHGLDDFSDLLIGWDSDKWIYQGYESEDYDTEKNTITFEFRYFEPVDGFNDENEAEKFKLEPLFTGLKVPATLTTEEIQSLEVKQDENVVEDATFKMILVGHAIQTAGFEADAANNKTAEDVAWEAFETQNPTTN